MNNQISYLLRPIIFVFVFVTVLAITGRSFLEKQNIDRNVVIIGNLVLFAVSLAAFLMTARSFRSANPQSFVRAMYGSFMVKFFVVIIAAFVYIMMAKKNVNKPALGVCAALYIIYMILETRALTRLLRKKKDA